MLWRWSSSRTGAFHIVTLILSKIYPPAVRYYLCSVEASSLWIHPHLPFPLRSPPCTLEPPPLSEENHPHSILPAVWHAVGDPLKFLLSGNICTGPSVLKDVFAGVNIQGRRCTRQHGQSPQQTGAQQRVKTMMRSDKPGFIPGIQSWFNI